MPPRREILAVFIGGMVGTLLRTGLVELLPEHVGKWPWATFGVNIVGCAVLGVVITQLNANGGSKERIALLGTGFCGGLTTFSTFQLEVYKMLDRGYIWLAAGYLFASVALGLTAVNIAKRSINRGSDVA